MAIKAETSFSLADQLFNAETVQVLAQAMASAWKPFDPTRFTRESLDAFPGLELKERIRHLTERLHAQLPDDFNRAVDILQTALPPPLDPTLKDDDFGQFIWCVPADWVAQQGLTEARLARSLEFLREATMRFTAEKSIRPFLTSYPEETLAFVHRCATDSNYHVRRLASEGIRPFLPWAATGALTRRARHRGIGSSAWRPNPIRHPFRCQHHERFVPRPPRSRHQNAQAVAPGHLANERRTRLADASRAAYAGQIG